MNELVCGPCLVEENLQAYVSQRGSKGCCSFCERRNRKAMPISSVAAYILECLRADYAFAEDKLPWAEGQFVGITYDTSELLEKIELGCEDGVLWALVEEIDKQRAGVVRWRHQRKAWRHAGRRLDVLCAGGQAQGSLLPFGGGAQ